MRLYTTICPLTRENKHITSYKNGKPLETLLSPPYLFGPGLPHLTQSKPEQNATKPKNHQLLKTKCFFNMMQARTHLLAVSMTTAACSWPYSEPEFLFTGVLLLSYFWASPPHHWGKNALWSNGCFMSAGQTPVPTGKSTKHSEGQYSYTSRFDRASSFDPRKSNFHVVNKVHWKHLHQYRAQRTNHLLMSIKEPFEEPDPCPFRISRLPTLQCRWPRFQTLDNKQDWPSGMGQTPMLLEPTSNQQPQLTD